MGGQGSGQSRNATDAVERLLAALLRRDQQDVAQQVAELDIAHRVRRSRMSGTKIHSLLSRVCESLGWEVQDAQANPDDHLGDVRVVLSSGEIRWIEVKAQTTKPNFADITQADYIRDDTDFLRKYDKVDVDFSALINSDLRVALQLDKGTHELATWSLDALWIADLALLDSIEKKNNANITDESQLLSFLERKHLLQLCMSGVRYVRLDELGPVRAILAGAELRTNVKQNQGSTAVVQVSAGHPPGHSVTDFTYHVGYKNSNATGRHKLHDYALSRSHNLVVFTA